MSKEYTKKCSNPQCLAEILMSQKEDGKWQALNKNDGTSHRCMSAAKATGMVPTTTTTTPNNEQQQDKPPARPPMNEELTQDEIKFLKKYIGLVKMASK